MFRYENMCTRDPTYESQIKENWSCNSGNLVCITSSLQKLQGALQKWSYKVFGSVRGQIRDLRPQLEEVRRKTWLGGITTEEKNLLKRLSNC